MASRVMTFRFPDTIARTIATRAKLAGSNKTAIVVEALTRAFEEVPSPAHSSGPTDSTVSIEDHLQALEAQVKALSQQVSQLLSQSQTAVTASPSWISNSTGFDPETGVKDAVSAIATYTNAPLVRVNATRTDSETNHSVSHLDAPQSPEAQQVMAQYLQQTRFAQQILAISPDPILVQNDAGQIIHLNPAAARLLGIDSRQALGKTLAELKLNAQLQLSFDEHRKLVLAIGRSTSYETSITANGGCRDYEFIAMPVQGSCSAIAAVVFTGRDVTERNRSEQGLRTAEAKYRNLFELANDSIFVVDATTQRFLDANPNASRRLGYTHQELMQLGLEDISAAEDPSQLQILWQQLRANGSLIFEQTYRCKDGTEIPVEVSSRVIEYENRLAFENVVRALTDLEIVTDSAVAKIHH